MSLSEINITSEEEFREQLMAAVEALPRPEALVGNNVEVIPTLHLPSIHPLSPDTSITSVSSSAYNPLPSFQPVPQQQQQQDDTLAFSSPLISPPMSPNSLFEQEERARVAMAALALVSQSAQSENSSDLLFSPNTETEQQQQQQSAFYTPREHHDDQDLIPNNSIATPAYRESTIPGFGSGTALSTPQQIPPLFLPQRAISPDSVTSTQNESPRESENWSFQSPPRVSNTPNSINNSIFANRYAQNMSPPVTKLVESEGDESPDEGRERRPSLPSPSPTPDQQNKSFQAVVEDPDRSPENDSDEDIIVTASGHCDVVGVQEAFRENSRAHSSPTRHLTSSTSFITRGNSGLRSGSDDDMNFFLSSPVARRRQTILPQNIGFDLEQVNELIARMPQGAPFDWDIKESIDMLHVHWAVLEHTTVQSIFDSVFSDSDSAREFELVYRLEVMGESEVDLGSWQGGVRRITSSATKEHQRFIFDYAADDGHPQLLVDSVTLLPTENIRLRKLYFVQRTHDAHLCQNVCTIHIAFGIQLRSPEEIVLSDISDVLLETMQNNASSFLSLVKMSLTDDLAASITFHHSGIHLDHESVVSTPLTVRSFLLEMRTSSTPVFVDAGMHSLANHSPHQHQQIVSPGLLSLHSDDEEIGVDGQPKNPNDSVHSLEKFSLGDPAQTPQLTPRDEVVNLANPNTTTTAYHPRLVLNSSFVSQVESVLSMIVNNLPEPTPRLIARFVSFLLLFFVVIGAFFTISKAKALQLEIQKVEEMQRNKTRDVVQVAYFTTTQLQAVLTHIQTEQTVDANTSKLIKSMRRRAYQNAQTLCESLTQEFCVWAIYDESSLSEYTRNNATAEHDVRHALHKASIKITLYPDTPPPPPSPTSNANSGGGSTNGNGGGTTPEDTNKINNNNATKQSGAGRQRAAQVYAYVTSEEWWFERTREPWFLERLFVM
eukprot:PhF_6_TR14884/c0_g1_i3/m.23195